MAGKDIADANGKLQAGRRSGITIEDSQERVVRVTQVLEGYSVCAEVNCLSSRQKALLYCSLQVSRARVIQINYEDL